MKPLHVQTVELVFVDFIAMEATFGFKEKVRFVKGPYALIPLAGPEVAADPQPVAEFLEHLKEFIGRIQRCEAPQQAANLAAAVLASWLADLDDREGA